jgi:hypothetical protein
LATSLLACLPVFFVKLLDYVAIYGLVLMPVGAIALAEHWLFPIFRIEQYRAQRLGWLFNWPALIVWFGTLAACAVMPVHLFFRWLPGWFLAVTAYTVLQAASQRTDTRARVTMVSR